MLFSLFFIQILTLLFCVYNYLSFTFFIYIINEN